VTFIKDVKEQKKTSAKDNRPKTVVSEKNMFPSENKNVTSPEKAQGNELKDVARTPIQVGQRAVKIREIFMLSGKLAQTPEVMKEQIGKIINLGTGISDSSQIRDDQLDLILSAFRGILAEKENTTMKEAA
jgi:hypothetical protein